MRPIKFRAWHKPSKVMWLLGKLGIKGHSTISILTHGKISDNMEVYDDEIELMQFTGLLDKNGKEIYEGDIIKFETLEPKKNETKVLPVEWRENCLGFRAREKCWSDWMFYGERTEIIGNIYENQEYLIDGQLYICNKCGTEEPSLKIVGDEQCLRCVCGWIFEIIKTH